ncbi:hypothetical protein TWF506_003239 [Arthrobotrys conoides]|uniref:Uncharacterized protein n=1 Tax=Arthrobotrys conoides TaxID=74498 RepID=A0AAN8RR25_9PEZI
MQRYRLREELMDLAHTANSRVEWTPAAKSGKPVSPTRKPSETDLIGVDKPKMAYTIGIRRVSVFNPKKASTSKPEGQAAGTPGVETESDSDETTTTTTTTTEEKDKGSLEGHVVECSIKHIPLGSALRGNVVHSDKITGEDGKVVPCLLCNVQRKVEVRTIGGKQYFFPTKIFTPTKTMVTRAGGEVIPGVPNIYGDAPYNADWTHKDEGELPGDILLYTDRACVRGVRFPYRDVMGEVYMTRSAFSYNDFVTGVRGGTIPDFKFTSRPIRRSSSPDSDSATGSDKGKDHTKPTHKIPQNPLLRDIQPVIHIISRGVCHTNVAGPVQGHFNPPNLVCTCGRIRATVSPPESLPSYGSATTSPASSDQQSDSQASTGFWTPPDSPGTKSRKKRNSDFGDSVVDETETKRQKVSEGVEVSQSVDPISSLESSLSTSIRKKRKREAADLEVEEPTAKLPRIRLIVRSPDEADSTPATAVIPGQPSLETATASQQNPGAATPAQPNIEAATTEQALSRMPVVRRIIIKFRRDHQDNEEVPPSPKSSKPKSRSRRKRAD